MTDKWKGIGKLVEEIGETLIELDRLKGFEWDGLAFADPTDIQCIDELADCRAAIDYFAEANKLTLPPCAAPHAWDRNLVAPLASLLQLCGKAIPFPVGPHPDGKGALEDRFPAALAAAAAAIDAEFKNNMRAKPHRAYFETRRDAKIARFRAWGLSGVRATVQKDLAPTSNAPAPQFAMR